MPSMSAADQSTCKAAGLLPTTIGKWGLKSFTAAETVAVLNALKAAHTLTGLTTAQIDELMGQVADLLPRVAG